MRPPKRASRSASPRDRPSGTGPARRATATGSARATATGSARATDSVPGLATDWAQNSAPGSARGSATGPGSRLRGRRHGLLVEGRVRELDRLLTGHRLLHEVVPDRGRDRAAEDQGHPFDVLERDLPWGSPPTRTPRSGRCSRRTRRPRCPGPCPSSARPVDVGGRPRSEVEDVLERVRDEVGDVLLDHALASRDDAFVDPAARRSHLQQRARSEPGPAVRQGGVRVRHLEGFTATLPSVTAHTSGRSDRIPRACAMSTTLSGPSSTTSCANTVFTECAVADCSVYELPPPSAFSGCHGSPF